MFRELARKDKTIPQEECIHLLETELRGVLSVLGDEDYPYGMPMNHFYHREDGCLYFHCGKSGHRLDALRKHPKASFCAYDEGFRKEGDWALHIRSVIVFGKIEIVDDMQQIIDICTKLSHKFTQDDGYIQHEIEQYAKAACLLRLVPEHITGKLVTES